jgi:GMP synthase-like glutamine amidotransferase
LNLYVKADQKMTQHPIVASLSLKGMSAREIHDDIVATLGADAVSYSLVTRYLREAQFPPSKPERHSADVQRDLDDSDQAILAALEESPFASVRQLSRLTHLPSTTLYRLSPSYPIAGICGASPLMGATYSVRCAKGRES